MRSAFKQHFLFANWIFRDVSANRAMFELALGKDHYGHGVFVTVVEWCVHCRDPDLIAG